MTRARRSHEPSDRLTRIGGRLIEHHEHDPEHLDGDRVIVMVLGGEDGAVALGGYGLDGDVDAIADMFAHLAAIMAANGRRLLIVPIGHDGGPKVEP